MIQQKHHEFEMSHTHRNTDHYSIRVLDSIVNQSIMDKSIEEVSQIRLVKIRDYVKTLIVQIKTLEEQIIRKDRRIEELEQELDQKDIMIESLSKSKKQIEKSIDQIVSFNSQYLDIIKTKQMQIEEYETKSLNHSCHYAVKMNNMTDRQGSHNKDYSNNQYLQLRSGKSQKDRKQRSNEDQTLKPQKRLLDKVKQYVTQTQIRIRNQQRHQYKVPKNYIFK